MSAYADLTFHLSSDINLDLKVYISKLKAAFDVQDVPDAVLTAALGSYVSVQVISEGVALHTVAKSTRLPEFQPPWLSFEEWITLPVKIRDLSPTSQLAIQLHGPDDDVTHSKTLRIFDRKLRLKRGLQRVELATPSGMASRVVVAWFVPQSETDTASYGGDTMTTDDLTLAEEEDDLQSATVSSVVADFPDEHAEYFRLLKLKEKYDRGEMQHSSWLDRLALRQVESMRLGLTEAADVPQPPPPSTHDQNSCWELYMEFPYFPRLVIYDEAVYEQPGDGLEVPVVPTAAQLEQSSANGVWTDRLCVVPDPDMHASNPAEVKYYKMNRGVTKDFQDKNLRPNLGDKEKLTRIVTSPAWNLATDDRDRMYDRELLWNFRYYLSADPKALIKFVMSVDWDDDIQVKEASELLQRWAPIQVEDALGLLMPEFSHGVVREFAVSVLSHAADEDLVSYLLQLVQALRYEPSLRAEDSEKSSDPSVVSMDDGLAARKKYKLSPLADFLISRAVRSIEVANYLSWFLLVEIEDDKHGAMFARVYSGMTQALERENRDIMDSLMRQREIVTRIVTMGYEATENKRDRIGTKIEKLNKLMSAEGPYHDLVHLRTAFVLPLQPKLKISGVVPGKAHIFKSKMYPLAITFAVHPSSGNDWSQAGDSRKPEGEAVDAASPRTFRVIFKNGDDLRQDQLVMQLIRLMDTQLKKVGLDLCLSPYTILATGSRAGMMEMVLNSIPVSRILTDYGNNILAFFRANFPSESDRYKVQASVMDTYVKSCAGYCVITFLLSIGDRHLENVLLTPDGHLLHIDFGYSFGNDPKPLPPPMKLTKEMVVGMGGPDSDEYKAFLSFCLQAYRVLRKSASLVLTLIRLMRDAGIKDLSTDPETVLMKLQDNFRLEISDEEAEYFFLDMIEQSVTAFFPVMAEIIHSIAVSLRR